MFRHRYAYYYFFNFLCNLGLQAEHGHKEMLRAVLESIAFGVKSIIDRLEDQIDYSKKTKEIR